MKKLFTLVFAIFACSVIYVNGQITDSFFDHVNYRGAFGATDWTSGWANWDPQNTPYGNSTINVSGDINTNTTWNSSNVYLLNGFVYVKNGVTLTIEQGTVIRGDKSTKGTLIIQKGGILNAIGTSNNPIVFTSNVEAGSRDYGDWGGIIICGKAQINVPGDTSLIEGGPSTYYGGGANPNDADSSGVLKYIRIEFPGIPLQPNQEINGLTFAGVGNKTIIDYIQVSYCGDDSYEWFGGTVNAKHLIAFRGLDDEYDSDYGYTGKLQFLVGLRDPNIADISGSNGFESDNDANGSTNTPQTNPIFSNVSLFGPKVTSATTINSNFKRALHIRRNSALNVYNSIFAGWPTGLYIDGSSAQTNADNSLLNVNNCVMSGMTKFFDVPSTSNVWASPSNAREWYVDSIRKNDTIVENTELQIVDPFNLSAPNFLPHTNSNMLIGSIWYMPSSVNNKINDISNINIFPNPTNGNFSINLTIENPNHIIINIYDITGKLVVNIANENLIAGNYFREIMFENMPNGLYFINFITNNAITSSKFIKK